MTTIDKCKLGGGVTLVVVAVTLAAITAIALAVIFAPPFLAAFAGAALYVAVACGVGTVAATIAAAILLNNKRDNYEHKSNSTDSKGVESTKEYSSTEEADIPSETKAQRTQRITDYLAVANSNYALTEDGKNFEQNLQVVIDEIMNNSNFHQFQDRYNLEMARLDLSKDETAERAQEIYDALVDIVDDMGKLATDD